MLTVDELSIGLLGRRGETIPVVERAWLHIGEGETLGLVGESGSGKSMLCRSLVGTLYRHSATVTGGSILFEGTELTGATDAVWRGIRGHRISCGRPAAIPARTSRRAPACASSSNWWRSPGSIR